MISNQIDSGIINIVDNKTVKKIINEVLDDVGSVASTLGPCGKANLIHDGSGSTSLYPSKDGFRIVSNIHYNDYFYDAIFKIIHEASMHNNTAIGDGTTSAIVILKKFFKELDSLISDDETDRSNAFKKVSRTGIVNILETLKFVLKDILIKKGYVRYITDMPFEKRMDIITKVATIAANNDRTIGEYIAKIFENCVRKGDDELFVEITPNFSKDTDESSEIGFKLPCGFIHRIYSTERDGRTALYENPRFLIFEGTLLDSDITMLEAILEYFCERQNSPLVIIADDYGIKLSQFLYTCRVGRKVIYNGREVLMDPMKIIPIRYYSGDVIGHERINDLEVALGAKAIPNRTQTWEKLGDGPEYWEKICGSADKIRVMVNDTIIVNGHGDKDAIEGRIQKINEDLNGMIYTENPTIQMTVEQYKERIGMLKSNMVSIRVGGLTFKERQYNQMVYEDAVYAVKSTIKNGFTLAGQSCIVKCVKKYKDEIIDKTVEVINREQRNVVFGKNRDETLRNAIRLILNIIEDTFQYAYSIALENAIIDKNEVKEIIDHINNSDEAITYNLITNEYESLNDEKNMLVAGNTDYETYVAVVAVVGIFLNSDNLQTIYIPVKATK